MSEHVSYVGTRVFIGIDVHREFFVVSAVSEGALVKTCRVHGQFEPLYSFITKYFVELRFKVVTRLGTAGFGCTAGSREQESQI